MSAASLAALPPPLRPTGDDWAKMLAAHVHLGTKNLDNRMVGAWSCHFSWETLSADMASVLAGAGPAALHSQSLHSA